MNPSIQSKSKLFWIHIAKYYLTLKEKKYYEIASQLFRSGTSIWANIAESQYASSKKDFINKLSISLKEAQETLYWLDILKEWFEENTTTLQNECIEIIKILIAIIKKSKINMQTINKTSNF